ncbi:MAG: tetratricopeptide repeat protein [Phycisphaerae bacterium]|nr:tetratricopeptide repeat protein [Saprospiraceae bacterium]
MKTSIVYILFSALCFPGQGTAQISRLSHAQQDALHALSSDQERVDTLNEWAYHCEQDTVLKRHLAQAAFDLAKNFPGSMGLGDSYLRLGRCAYLSGNFEEAEHLYKKGLQIRESLQDYPKIVACYILLGNLQKQRGRYDESIEAYQKGLAILKDQPPHPNLAALYNSLGAVYRLKGQYEQALQQYQRSQAVYEQLLRQPHSTADSLELRLGMAMLSMNIGEFLQSGRTRLQEARDTLLKCLSDFELLHAYVHVGKCMLLLGNNAYYSSDLDAARKYYEKGLVMKDSIDANDYNLLLKNLGRTYLDQGKYKAAQEDFQASLLAFKKINNTRETASTLFELGNCFYEQSDFQQAVLQYKEALGVAFDDPILRAGILYFLSDALYQLGLKSEVDEYTGEYISLLNHLNSEQTQSAFGELMHRQIDKNRLLKQYVQKEKQTQQTYGLIGLGILSLLLLLALLSARLQRQKRRLAEQNAEIARQQEQLVLQKNLDLLKNKELENNYARLAGQDEMQRKIGQELHDGVGAMLASVKLNLSPVDEVLDYLPENNRRQYATANRLLGEASEEVRRISHELSSAVLQKFGLKAQLEALADIIPGSGKLQVELATHGLKERLDYKTELHIYRMVQELVHNVVKHAQAQNITIQVNRFEHAINVIVEDDGRGFDLEKIRQSPGIGMQNLAARVHDLNGEMQIDSRPGRGTMVSIDIPLKS